jgi:hypothetical protein
MRLLVLIGCAQRADIIHRMIIADELERIGNALDQVGGLDDGHLAFMSLSYAPPCTAGPRPRG